MPSVTPMRNPTAPDLSLLVARSVLDRARFLCQAAQAGIRQPLLRGRKLGLLYECAGDPDAALFRRAAEGLGAHVAAVRPSLSRQTTRREVKQAAHLLGRLYDAVECQRMPAALVQQIRDAAGVPVYDGIATATHPTAGLVELLEGIAAHDDRRLFVLQAVLLDTLG